MQLGRAGFGSMTFVDNESMSPHNAARHALIERTSVLVPPSEVGADEDGLEGSCRIFNRARSTPTP